MLPGYFDTLGTPLLAGRAFTDADNAPERKLAIVDQLLAAKAAHQRQTSLAEPGREQVYFTDGFMGHGAADRWAVRTAGDPARYAGQVGAEISGIGRQLLVTGLQPMQTYVERVQDGTAFPYCSSACSQ